MYIYDNISTRTPIPFAWKHRFSRFCCDETKNKTVSNQGQKAPEGDPENDEAIKLLLSRCHFQKGILAHLGLDSFP